LTEKIFRENHPEGKQPGGLNGNWYWETEEGINLWNLSFQAKKNDE
jgi:hypothetical protein